MLCYAPRRTKGFMALATSTNPRVPATWKAVSFRWLRTFGDASTAPLNVFQLFAPAAGAGRAPRPNDHQPLPCGAPCFQRRPPAPPCEAPVEKIFTKTLCFCAEEHLHRSCFASSLKSLSHATQPWSAASCKGAMPSLRRASGHAAVPKISPKPPRMCPDCVPRSQPPGAQERAQQLQGPHDHRPGQLPCAEVFPHDCLEYLEATVHPPPASSLLRFVLNSFHHLRCLSSLRCAVDGAATSLEEA